MKKKNFILLDVTDVRGADSRMDVKTITWTHANVYDRRTEVFLLIVFNKKAVQT
ncbi:MAG: hypothetical protein ACOYLT_10020 [Flavobacterium sp.]|uniref:hypothetical protein n=1 Tax=Flavobacterium sp. TaxID=239 RepID=UPI003BD38C67